MGARKTAHARKPASKRTTGKRKTANVAISSSLSPAPLSSPPKSYPRPRPTGRAAEQIEALDKASESVNFPDDNEAVALLMSIGKSGNEEREKEKRLDDWVTCQWQRFQPSDKEETAASENDEPAPTTSSKSASRKELAIPGAAVQNRKPVGDIAFSESESEADDIFDVTYEVEKNGALREYTLSSATSSMA